MVKQIVCDKPLIKIDCTLGEGPLYDDRTGILHFVDIPEKRVYHYDTKTAEVTREQYDAPIGCLALLESSNELACAAHKGFATLDKTSINYFSTPLSTEEVTNTRFNDGACDSKGRFYAGTLCAPDANIPGRLFRYDPHTKKTEVIDEGPFTDSNGCGWSPDDKTFYFTDSLVNIIWKYDHDDGKLTNRRVFINAVELGYDKDTYCDGMAIDDQGGVWSARWGSSCITRFTPEGAIDLEVVFPTAGIITACTFGGPNNDQLYVTTAHTRANNGDTSRQQKWPDCGHVFVVDLAGQFKGVIRHRFAQ